MSFVDPLSLAEVKRLAGGADTVLLRATRDADLETPIGAFLRLATPGGATLGVAAAYAALAPRLGAAGKTLEHYEADEVLLEEPARHRGGGVDGHRRDPRPGRKMGPAG